MYCENCGTKLNDGDRYCTNCGHSTESEMRRKLVEIQYENEKSKSVGWTWFGMIMLTSGLGTLFGPVGTVVGLVVGLIAVVVAAKGK